MSARAYLVALLRFTLAHERGLALSALALVLAAAATELGAMAAVYELSTIAAGRTLGAGKLAALLEGAGWAPSLRSLVVFFCLVVCARAIAHVAGQWAAVTLGKRVQARLSSRAFARVLADVGLGEVEERSIGHYIALAGDETARAGAMIESLTQLVGLAALSLLYAVGILRCSPYAAAGAAAFCALSLLGAARSFAHSQRVGERRSLLQASAHSIFLDALNGLRAVRAFRAEGFAAERYRVVIFAYVRALASLETLSTLARTLPAAALTALAAVCAAVWLPADAAGIDLAAWIAILFFALRLFPAAGQGMNLALRVAAEARAGRDVTALAESKPPSAAGLPRIDRPVREIRVEGLSFAYSGRAAAVSGRSFTLRAGRSYALVGPSGSGKSTVLDLLIALRRPSSGRILVDGCDAAVLDADSIRQHVLLAGQTAVVLNDTVAANIAFGIDVTPEAIARAADATALADDIEALPRGYATVLGYQGAGLSGGQRQRLCLARALVRDPDVLLLDEATAALDGPTRDRVVTNVLARFRERVVVFATHDPAVIARVDEVIDVSAPAAGAGG